MSETSDQKEEDVLNEDISQKNEDISQKNEDISHKKMMMKNLIMIF